MSSIEIRNVGITNVGTDAIVNAANEGLWAGGGVCGAIFNAAGMNELTAACDAIGHCDTGSAVITPGFRISKYIIHAVGPRWRNNHDMEKRQLYSCYKAALKLAVANGCKSIGFPLISAGIFGVPVDVAWRKALQACTEFDGDIKIVFAIIDDSILAEGNRILASLTNSETTSLQSSSNSMIIFHDTDKPYGFLSNWYLSDFTIRGMKFSSVEKYLMYRKAELFGDTVNMNNIMSSDDPDYIKQCGRTVSPYNDTVWNGMRQLILFEGIWAKFHDNPALCQQLLATGNSMLVEGTASDAVFANGLKRDDPNRYDIAKWSGKNLLGFTLMEVRNQISNPAIDN